jgi:hypothetical protein
MKQAADLVDCRPVIIIDTCEQASLVFRNLPSERGTRATGDYSFAGREGRLQRGEQEHPATQRPKLSLDAPV